MPLNHIYEIDIDLDIFSMSYINYYYKFIILTFDNN
jgi:hypothetical protein